MKNSLFKLIIMILGALIGLFSSGIKCTSGGEEVLYGAPLTSFTNVSAVLEGRVVEKANPLKGINGIKISWSNQISVPYTLSGTDGTWNITEKIDSSNEPSTDYSIYFRDIDGTENGGLFISNTISGTFEVISTATYGEKYYSHNIIIEMEKLY